MCTWLSMHRKCWRFPSNSVHGSHSESQQDSMKSAYGVRTSGTHGFKKRVLFFVLRALASGLSGGETMPTGSRTDPVRVATKERIADRHVVLQTDLSSLASPKASRPLRATRSVQYYAGSSTCACRASQATGLQSRNPQFIWLVDPVGGSEMAFEFSSSLVSYKISNTTKPWTRTRQTHEFNGRVR